MNLTWITHGASPPPTDTTPSESGANATPVTALQCGVQGNQVRIEGNQVKWLPQDVS
jgi:hypothetical protein